MILAYLASSHTKSLSRVDFKLNDQVEKLIAHLKLGEDEIKKRETICAELSQIFKQFWPETGQESCLNCFYN